MLCVAVRVALGRAWLSAWWEKFNNPAWMSGHSLLCFWTGALATASGAHPTVGFDWYAGFLNNLVSSQSQTWFAPLVAFGEFLGGIALILGLFTGIAAFLLTLLNFNFLLAGSAGWHPVYFILAPLIVLAWEK